MERCFTYGRYIMLALLCELLDVHNVQASVLTVAQYESRAAL